MKNKYIKQHVVPQSYLKRFGVKNSNNKGYHIGVCHKCQKTNRLFIQAVDNIAYIDNYYDVSTREDPKYWERYFSEQIEPLYGDRLKGIISRVTLQSSDDIVISVQDKITLSKMICFQFIRVPAFLNPYIEKGKEYGTNLIGYLKNTFKEIVPEKTFDNLYKTNMADLAKDIALGAISDEEKLRRYSEILAERPWIIYYNKSSIPFVTSDNPVLMLNLFSKSFDYESNGIGRNDNVVFFPLSSRIMVQIFPNGLIGESIKDYDCNRMCLGNDDINFIIESNILQIEHATKQAYMEPMFLEEIMAMDDGNEVIKNNV